MSQKMSKELFPTEGISIKTEDAEDDDKKQSVITPNAKKSTLCGPRTPTPFKNALNEIRKIHGQTYVPSSPNGLVEDITEIMNKEQQQDSTMDSVYETDSSIVVQPIQNEKDDAATISNPKRLTYDKDEMDQQQKKAKKSLESTWNATSTESTDFPYLVETPVCVSVYSNLVIMLNFKNDLFISYYITSNHKLAEQGFKFKFRSCIFSAKHR